MSDAAPLTPAAPATPVSSYAAATQTIRATVRWLLTAAAGVAGVLVAGLQLTNLGSLKLDDPRMWIAVLGLSAALAGIGCIILITSRILTDDWITLAQLSLDEFQETLAKRQKQSTAGLMADLEVYQHELYAHVASSIPDLYKQLMAANEAARQPSKKRSWGKATIATESSSASKTAMQLREAAGAVVQYANYYSARNRLRALPKQLLPAAGAVVAGVLVFAYTANPPKKESPTPTVTITVAPSSASPMSPSPASPSPQTSPTR